VTVRDRLAILACIADWIAVRRQRPSQETHLSASRSVGQAALQRRRCLESGVFRALRGRHRRRRRGSCGLQRRGAGGGDCDGM
jgi:hypothetical protein